MFYHSVVRNRCARVATKSCYCFLVSFLLIFYQIKCNCGQAPTDDIESFLAEIFSPNSAGLEPMTSNLPSDDASKDRDVPMDNTTGDIETFLAEIFSPNSSTPSSTQFPPSENAVKDDSPIDFDEVIESIFSQNTSLSEPIAVIVSVLPSIKCHSNNHRSTYSPPADM